MEKYFNFNNEEYVLTIDVREDGSVTFVANGQPMRFDSVLDLAHNYAIARNVASDNLKNWVLVEDGDFYSFVLRAATAGADFFSSPLESRRVLTTYGDDEDEYEDEEYEEDVLTINDLSYEELEVLKYVQETDDYEELSDAIYDDEDLYEELKDRVAHYKELTNGNFSLGFGIVKALKKIKHGEVPTSELDAANRGLTMASVAHRDSVQIVLVNATEETVEFRQRLTTSPFRNTELVVNIAGTFVVFER